MKVLMLSLYQPLIENARFYRLFCSTLMLFILAVLAYLIVLMQIAGLWFIFAACSVAGLIYLIYLNTLSDAKVLAKAEQWIELDNQRFQNSAYGIQGDALMVLVLIFPFVLSTWLLYGWSKLFKK
ncbi:hypothetical protein BS636_09610 [Acinetobacter sp. LoGeW2-3]|uniref:hypothetical protein n=1 Tax=Acinetobacter sp. LoGeW2-3 TaxID=1808001 RepID=UPI000C05A772|nr:hypothetical protein [Acinetobacter sp. LoGeW2-3]ATO19886.1 hypothetical protein BS636_09610 [Acinetobacter sp. LoGeW2-3]